MLKLIEDDGWLKAYEPAIQGRYDYFIRKMDELKGGKVDRLSDFALGHLYFGLHKTEDEWVIREWAPNATSIYFLCDSNGWKRHEAYSMERLDNGVWELYMPIRALKHGDHYKLEVEWDGGAGQRVPAWARYVTQDPDTQLFSARVFDPEKPFRFNHARPTLGTEPLLIYESHVGMATEEEKVGTYNEFRENVLPMVKAKGYNAVQLMAVMEHPYYGSFGYQVSNFFAPSSRFGTPDDLKALVDEAHRLGLLVIMDLVHSHAARNEEEGIARFDGTHTQYFHGGSRMIHPEWNSMVFDYGKNEVLHFLLSNCRYWLEEFNLDGYRFDGVTSMLYLNHALGQTFATYGDYFNGAQDTDAIVYLQLANRVIHETYPGALTIAEEVSGMPGIARPIDEGGYGFDYRLQMNIPDFWIKQLKEKSDEDLKPGSIWWETTNRRYNEKNVSYAESHDQALVGDKTIIFWLMDKEMYWHMDRADDNAVVARGMAYHKMIRLVTSTTMNGAYLNFMGNEFGHPEWIDFPREGNDWSYKYARRQWSLASNGFLKYAQLQDFDRDMLAHICSVPDFEKQELVKLWEQNEDQVLAYERGDYVYVFNFHPTKSYTDYGILAPNGKYRIALDTDAPEYGGFGLQDPEVEHFTKYDPEFSFDGKGRLMLYLPARTALVLRRVDGHHYNKK